MSESRYYRYVRGIVPGVPPYDYKDKGVDLNYLVSYMLARTQQMFRWSGLPDTIPARSLELYLQYAGDCCIARVNGDLYALTGGMGGEPDPYYMPTLYTVANPALGFSASLRIHEDCEVISNDSLYLGLLPMLRRYCTLMVEADASMRIALINSRMLNLITAGDDRTKASAEEFLRRLEGGDLSVIGEGRILEGISSGLKSLPVAGVGSERLSDLIEATQYLKASLWNELGLDANYNMKRESINSGESQMNRDALLPLVDDMLSCRRRGAEAVNRMFGTEISVELASSWEDNQEELDAEQDALETESGEDPAEEQREEEDDGSPSETE